MYYQECSPLEKLLLKLTYCRGIGLVGKWRINKVCQEFQTTNFTLYELMKIARITQFSGIFKDSWQELNENYLQKLLENQPFITYFSREYPQQLKEQPYPPLILFYAGNLKLLDYPMLAVVGARQASGYGRKICKTLIPKMIERHYVIVSGLAKGIDAFAHQAAIEHSGNTIAVIGTGIDQTYPKENQTLQQTIQKHHLLISEFPRKTGPKKHHFPLRNRIIAGLSQGVCVIEAGQKSGSLITAQFALDNGREVFAIPGDIFSKSSAGCHQLIQDGAKCTTSAEDIWCELPEFY